jgi:hypothetical protein
MYSTRRIPLGILLLLVSSFPPVYSQVLTPAAQTAGNNVNQVQHVRRPVRLIEEFSFLIKDFRFQHQSELNNLNISISYRYVSDIANSDYPDFRLLAKDVETFLTNYPNEVDYWEIVNKQLTSLLLKKYPALTTITSELKVDPSQLDPYTRSSRVSRTRPVVRSSRNRALS